MGEQKLKPCPVECLVSISNPGTIIKTNQGRYEIFEQVLHAQHIPEKVETIFSKYPEKKLTPYYLQKFSQILIEEHTPEPINVLQTYGISDHEILPGVICPCGHNPMIRERRIWVCPKCKHRDQNAHIQAIEDFLYLFNQLTNRQCREFLQITNHDIARRLLESLPLHTKGNGKAKVYFLNV